MKLGLLWVLLIAAASVMAANVTVTQTSNVSIICNNQSSCVAVAFGGSPIIFNAPDANLTVSVPITISFEPNVTVVQNVTNYTQTVQVTTQNITVVSCNQSADVKTITDGVVSGVATSIQGSIANTCATSCLTSEETRRSLEAARVDAERLKQECTVNWDAYKNVTEQRYEYLNSTCTAEIEDLESELTINYFLLFMGLIVVLGSAVYVIRKGAVKNFVKGRMRRQMPPGGGVA